MPGSMSQIWCYSTPLFLISRIKRLFNTSSLCANLAMNIQQSQPEARLVVADLVLPIVSIGPIVGEEGQFNLVTVAELAAAHANADFFTWAVILPSPII